MVQTTFYGEIENGNIVLPEDVKLPDRAKVYVTVSEIEAQPRPLRRMPTPRLKRPDAEQKGVRESVETQPKTRVYVPESESSAGPRARRILRPRLANPADAARFKKTVVEIDEED